MLLERLNLFLFFFALRLLKRDERGQYNLYLFEMPATVQEDYITIIGLCPF